MTFVFHMILCILFVILQTAIFPLFPMANAFFDLFIPLVVYMGLFRSLQQSIPALVIFGWVMDSLSAAPFGVYLSCYIWIFAIVYWFKGFLHIHSFTLLSLIVFLGALLQNITVLMVSGIIADQWYNLPEITRVLFVQLASAAILGPFIILYTKAIYEKAVQALHQLTDEF